MTNEDIKILNNKTFLTPIELQKIYGFGIDNQAKMRMNRKIPFSKIGRYIRYSRMEIEKWIKNNRIEMV